MKAREKLALKRRLGVSKSVSTLCTFKKLSQNKLDDLKKRQLKKQTYNKMQWGVRTFNEWRINRLNDVVNFDVKIFESDLSNVKGLTKANLCHALCTFIPEVTKQKDGSDYPG